MNHNRFRSCLLITAFSQYPYRLRSTELSSNSCQFHQPINWYSQATIISHRINCITMTSLISQQPLQLICFQNYCFRAGFIHRKFWPKIYRYLNRSHFTQSDAICITLYTRDTSEWPFQQIYDFNFSMWFEVIHGDRWTFDDHPISITASMTIQITIWWHFPKCFHRNAILFPCYSPGSNRERFPLTMERFID